MSPDRRLAYILGTFPQASQTFIAREVRGLRRERVPLVVFALARRSPALLEVQDVEWYGDVRFAPFVLAPSVLGANLSWLARAPRRYLGAFARVVGLPHRPRIMAVRAVGLVMTAAWIAREIERTGGCRQIHAHFALAQTEVAMAVAVLLERPFSFTAHARDIYATPSALEEKIRAASLVVTCTGHNVEHLRQLRTGVPGDRVQLVHHGVEFAAIPARARADDNGPLRFVAAGRLVEKKGFDVLIDACAILRDRGRRFECRLFGTGPLASDLAQAIARHGLQDRITLNGWISAEALGDEMRQAGVFVMPSRVSRQGDRDGIPNVILEAMAAGLPVVATRVSGIPEAVTDGDSGRLVEPDDPSALAEALDDVLANRERRAAMGQAGRQRALERFDLAVSSKRLAALFDR